MKMARPGHHRPSRDSREEKEVKGTYRPPAGCAGYGERTADLIVYLSWDTAPLARRHIGGARYASGSLSNGLCKRRPIPLGREATFEPNRELVEDASPVLGRHRPLAGDVARDQEE